MNMADDLDELSSDGETDKKEVPSNNSN